MTLGQKQRAFSLMVAKLILHIYERKYEVSLGDAYAKTGHKEGSNHYIKLAIDLNFFFNGEYISDGSKLGWAHDYWDTLGGAPRIEGDMNHFAVKHNGRY